MFGASHLDEIRALRPRGLASAVGVWRVHAGGDSAVLKLLALGAAPTPRWPSQPGVPEPYYWRREADAYASGVLEPFGVPGLRASVERADGSCALWLEDCGDPPPWTPELLGDVARRLGRVQAELAAAPPEAAWLARDWLRAYLAVHDVPPDEEVLARLDGLPRTVCHNDLHPDNVLGGDAGVVVDWGYCGLGAPGLDAGVLVADGVADGAFPAGEADAVADAVWTAYLDGLGAGWDEDGVRFAFTAGTALRLSWLPRGRSPAWDATIEFLERLASRR